MIATVVRYWHTLRYLKPVQFYGRVRFRVRPRLDIEHLPATHGPFEGEWRAPVPRPASLLGAGRFLLLGQPYNLPATGGWDEEAVDKLRRYNLHYFDDLCAAPTSPGMDWHSAWIARWVAENPPRQGSGWEPYPVSLRIVNWIKWLLVPNDAPASMVESLALQARWLSRRLEWHLLGNHLFANAKALIFAGLFFEGPEAEAWLGTALDILSGQLDEQLLADGGHFELSPMYHAIFTEDVLDLVNIASAHPGRIPDGVIAKWRDAVPRMLRFLAAMSHPDGEISQFNDAAVGIAANLADLEAYAARLGIPVDREEVPALLSLPDSGYIRMGRGPAVAILDVARVGPDYLPGHAHADTLSFELSLRQRRVIVNGGTSEYGTGPIRLFERSTAAHSTVELDGVSSSEVWSGFRVARRARPFGLRAEPGSPIQVACAHDGYRRLAGKPVHRRLWCLSDVGLVVEDEILGAHGRAVARFVVAPGISVSAIGADRFRLDEGTSALMEVRVVRGRAARERAHQALRFGDRLETSSIDVTLEDGRSRVEFNWL